MTIFRDLTETRELVDSFTRPAETLLPVSRLRDDPAGEGARWGSLAELGWLAIGLPEDAGGVGLSAVEEALAAQTFGRHLISTDYPATVIAAHALVRRGEAGLAGEIAAGARRAHLAFRQRNGADLVAIDATDGAWLVVLTEQGVDILENGTATLHDAEHWGRPVSRIAAAEPMWSLTDPELAQRGRLLVAAMLAGIAAEARSRAVEYAQVREQFGQPIGAFQAVKHHCANMAIAAYAAQELVTFAAVSLAEHANDAVHLVHAALNLALRAARDNAGLNIQVHGGMGFSEECDAHLFLKAARLLDAAVGGIGTVRGALMRAA